MKISGCVEVRAGMMNKNRKQPTNSDSKLISLSNRDKQRRVN